MVAWPLYPVMAVYVGMGALVLAAPAKLMERYYSAEKMTELVSSSMYPAFVSVARYVGIFSIINTYFMATEIADGDVDDAAFMSLLISGCSMNGGGF